MKPFLGEVKRALAVLERYHGVVRASPRGRANLRRGRGGESREAPWTLWLDRQGLNVYGIRLDRHGIAKANAALVDEVSISRSWQGQQIVLRRPWEWSNG